ncbi:MAG: LysR family transcriptional regulator [Ramlibacter sp.]
MGTLNQQWDGRIGRRLKLRDLHILAAVVQWGSMAKAASQLAMSQPAVSESIASLEGALRVRLLDRSSRGVAPTLYARALLRRAEVVFDELRQAVGELEYLADKTVGEVRVACGDTMAAGLLPEVIDRFSRRHPGIVLRVVQANADTLDFRELRERQVDLALARVPTSLDDDDLDVELLLDDRHRVVAGAASRWARRRKVTLAELADEPWLFAANHFIRELIADAFRAQGLAVPQERVSANSILLRNRLLATGRFLTVLPESVLRYNAKQWSLKALPIDLGAARRPAAIVTLRNRTQSPVVGHFIEHLRAAAKAWRQPPPAPQDG